MLESVIVLRDSLEALPGGFRDTTEVYRREAGGEPTSVEHFSSARMFVERALLNRNSLVSSLPESVFSPRLVADRGRQLVFRCALAEFGASAFQKKGLDLNALQGDELKKARESYGNSPLRIHEKREDKLRDEFCKGWPPVAHDKKTLELIAEMRTRYADAFCDRELDRFLEDAAVDLKRYEGMTPGPDAFAKILQTERGQDSLLWGLELWDRFEDDPELGKPPVVELVERLASSFRGAGYHESAVSYFETVTLESFEEYRRSFYECSSLWNACKGAVIYNVVIGAFYGPKNASKNCYASQIARTQVVDYLPRNLAADGPLQAGKGEAVIRQVLPGGVAHVVEIVNLDDAAAGDGRLVVVVGREFGGAVRELPAVQDSAVQLARRMVPAETAQNFFPTDEPADSARHLGIYVCDGQLVVVDLVSSNGTVVVRSDGAKVCLGAAGGPDAPLSADLMRGDRVFLGDSELEVL